MIEEVKLRKVGNITSCNGREGLLDFSLSKDYELSEEPVYVYIDELPVPYFIESANHKRGNSFYVKLFDIDSFQDAEALVGKELFAATEADIEEEASEGFEFLIGWKLYDGRSRKALGEITDFVDIPNNPCLEINGESLIPLAEDFIAEIDEKKDRLYMNLPEGLL